jgi:FkbM family methyltransferase
MKEAHLKKLLSEGRKKYENFLNSAYNGIYLYGAGFVGAWAVDYFKQLGIPVYGFIDSNEKKRGQIVAGKPIYCLADLCSSQARNILISSRHAVPAIEASLLSSCNFSPLSVDAFVVHHAYPEKVDRVMEFFCHCDESLGTFWAVLASMLEGNTRALTPYGNAHPFFDRFGFFNRDGEIFVDAGAYVGDSIERFIWSVNGVFREIHAFEPGKVQFDAMVKRMSRLSEEWAFSSQKVILNNKALVSQNGKLRLSNANSLIQSKIVNGVFDGKSVTEIEGISLDSYLNGGKVSLIKVDVEGSEKFFLEGASGVIKQCRPRIALSVYHYPTDIFELPMNIMQINPEYKLFLGHHSSQLMDTVLYCRDKND